jgi:hypothetical protein
MDRVGMMTRKEADPVPSEVGSSVPRKTASGAGTDILRNRLLTGLSEDSGKRRQILV